MLSFVRNIAGRGASGLMIAARIAAGRSLRVFLGLVGREVAVGHDAVRCTGCAAGTATRATGPRGPGGRVTDAPEIGARRMQTALLGALLGAAVLSAPALAQGPRFVSAEQALEQGIQAYRGDYYEIAVPALAYAGEKGSLAGKFYLARIYADGSTSWTDHAKAFELYREVAVRSNVIDADLDPRAYYVAKSLTALAGYMQRGLPAIGIVPNDARAARYLNWSANHFGDADAQFQLAKLQLRGAGIRKDVPLALDSLSRLSKRGHASAQALLANMFWRGIHVKKDKAKALALITVAVANAPEHERFWIEDIYQDIYCGTSAGTRKQAGGHVANWRNSYGSIILPQRKREDELPAATRVCGQNEEIVPSKRTDIEGWLRATETNRDRASAGSDAREPAGPALPHETMAQEGNSGSAAGIPAAEERRIMQGTMNGFSLRDVGSPATGR